GEHLGRDAPVHPEEAAPGTFAARLDALAGRRGPGGAADRAVLPGHHHEPADRRGARRVRLPLMAKRLSIRGRVQGVGYRQWMVEEAQALGLTGWVRNRRDGSVEALVDGTPEQVAQLVERAHRGPPAARVTSVDAEDAEGRFEKFGWLPTE